MNESTNLISDRLNAALPAPRLRGSESRLQPAALPPCRAPADFSMSSGFRAPYCLKARTLGLSPKGVRPRVFRRPVAQPPAMMRIAGPVKRTVYL